MKWQEYKNIIRTKKNVVTKGHYIKIFPVVNKNINLLSHLVADYVLYISGLYARVE